MSTHDEILRLGDDLMRMHGFNAFSYYHLADALKVRPAAVHYHFPTKDALALSIVNRSREAFHSFSERVLLEADLQIRLKSFVRIFAENADTGKICLMGAAGADFYSLSEDTRGAVRLFVLDIIAWLTDLLDEGRQCGDFTFDGLPRTRALLIATNLAASLHMARILGKKEFQSISGQLVKDICPSKKSTKRSSSKVRGK
ncbi:MAG: TetR/AcrR family transcriptional regulator [Sideroxydans sp.]|nr:TetR/AcrR family transcriptional regulator [Sideroxydans sp.]